MASPSTLLALALLALAMAAPGQAVFEMYPPHDECPSTGYQGAGPPSCPLDVCPEQRQACDLADALRRQCLADPFCGRTRRALTRGAALVACDLAAACVRSTCSSSFPPGGQGQSCRVRSFYAGHCCCASCTPPPAVQPPDDLCCAFIPTESIPWVLACSDPTHIPGAIEFPLGTVFSDKNSNSMVLCSGRFPVPIPPPFILPSSEKQLNSTPNGEECGGKFANFYEDLKPDGSFVVKCD